MQEALHFRGLEQQRNPIRGLGGKMRGPASQRVCRGAGKQAEFSRPVLPSNPLYSFGLLP